MAKILCVGDIHVMDKPPAGATDVYLEDLFSNLRHTAVLAKEHGVDAVVWAGDVFHHKNPARTSHATVLRVIETIREYQAADIPLYIVTGNHDISNDVLESVRQKQPLGVILEAGAIELDGWAPDLPLFGVPWQQDWETVNLHDVFYRKGWGDHGDDAALAVTHCSIFPPGEAPEMYESIQPEAIAEAMGGRGALYYGHIHEDHGVYECGGVTFANVGALSRGSLHEYNLQRGIHAALWEDGAFTVLDIPHRPAEDILRVAEHHEEKREKMDLQDFVSSVGSSTLKMSSTADIVEHINTMQDVDQRVRRRAVDLIEEVS